MPDQNNDVVAAKLQLDTTKIMPAFKVIDEGVKQNATSFKVLNQELSVTEKNYTSLAKAMDKIVLSSDERKKKIMDESNALVAQRKASAELLVAKKNTLDLTNQVVDSKYQAQQAIVKKRLDAIEQQEKEHQERLVSLKNKTMAEGGRVRLVDTKVEQNYLDSINRQKKSNDHSERLETEHQEKLKAIQLRSSGSDNLIQSKIDREFQMMKNGDAKLEMQAERHAATMKKLTDPVNQRNILGSATGYLMAGSLYYSAVRGAREAITVIADFEDSVVNLKRVMSSGADIKFVEKSMINDAKEYGFALKDVGSVYVDIAQQGYNEKDTALLAKTALMAKNVESSFKDAGQAQHLLTGAMKNLGLEASQSERTLDRLNQVSNDYATDSNKLLQGINRVGASAKNAGIPINTLIGYLTVLNEGGQTGAVAGNAIKSFISFSSRDIAIDKLEQYVGLIKKTSGEMMPFSEIIEKVASKWKTYSDVQRQEITQAIARGDQASRFTILMENYDQVLKATATAENSLGSAQRENALAMTTLSKQTAQLKASWEGLMVSIGEAGLLSILKSIVHESKLLVDGFNSLPGPIRNTLIVTLALGAGITALNTGMRLLTGQSLIAMVSGLVSATRAMFAVKVATDAANLSQKAFIATPIGAALTALAAVIGIVTIAWSHYEGKQNEVNMENLKQQSQVSELGRKYNELKKIVDQNTGSEDEMRKTKEELKGVVDRLAGAMPNLISKWNEHGEAIEVNNAKLETFMTNYKKMSTLELSALPATKSKIEGQLKAAEEAFYSPSSSQETRDYALSRMKTLGEQLKAVDTQISNGKKGSVEESMQNLRNKGALPFNLIGDEKKHTGDQTDEEIEEAYKERKDEFNDEMARFHHLVNIESAGYKEAADQASKLREIRDKFSDLNEEDLFGIVEETYRTDQGIKTKAKGIKGEKEPKQFTFPLNDIDNQKIQAEDLVNGAMALIDQFAAKEFALGDSIDKVATKTTLYTDHQNSLRDANILLKDSLSELAEKQDILNELYKSGSINTDEYNKSTEDVQSRLKSFNQERAKNSIDWWKDEKEKFDLKDKRTQDSFDFSEKWISHEKASREMASKEEYEAWIRVQGRYVKGTELRKKADEQVYAAKKSFMKEEEGSLDKLVTKEKERLTNAKKTELDLLEVAKNSYVKIREDQIRADEALKTKSDRDHEDELQKIEKAKDEYTKAQDVKIQAIDRLMSKEQDANEDKDYGKELGDKQARAKVLESAVGPEGIKERKKLLEEIKKIEDDHGRVLRKRDLESQKQTLEDQKSVQVDKLDVEQKTLADKKKLKDRSFEDDKKRLEEEIRVKEEQYQTDVKAIEAHYTTLLKSFDNFKNDVEGRAETLKNLQVAKDLEKNTLILTNLDTFITEYKAKMDSIANIAQSQEQIDLQRYNGNIEKWNTGDTASKDAAHTENNMIRKKYNIPLDTGKLQHFADGGVVRGRRGEAVPTIAHGGEMYINESQQSNLFKLLNFTMPQMKFNMPSFDFKMPSTSVVNNYNFDNSMGNVAVNGGNGVAGLYDQRDGLIERQRGSGGGKQR